MMITKLDAWFPVSPVCAPNGAAPVTFARSLG